MTPAQEAKIDELIAMMRAMRGNAAASVTKQDRWDDPVAVGDATLLDGPYGNPSVYERDPAGWTGRSFVGATASEVPPDYGEMQAAALYKLACDFRDQNKLDKNGNPMAWRRFQESAAFRGWARRPRKQQEATDETEPPF